MVVILHYYWSPTATIQSLGEYEEFEGLGHSLRCYTYYRWRIHSEGPLLFALVYQLLPLTTTQYMIIGYIQF